MRDFSLAKNVPFFVEYFVNSSLLPSIFASTVTFLSHRKFHSDLFRGSLDKPIEQKIIEVVGIIQPPSILPTSDQAIPELKKELNCLGIEWEVDKNVSLEGIPCGSKILSFMAPMNFSEIVGIDIKSEDMLWIRPLAGNYSKARKHFLDTDPHIELYRLH